MASRRVTPEVEAPSTPEQHELQAAQVRLLAREKYLAEGQLVPRRLELRVGAQVILLRNIPTVGVNGSRGVLLRMAPAATEYVRLVSYFEKVVAVRHDASSPLVTALHRRILDLVERTSDGLGERGTLPTLQEVLERPAPARGAPAHAPVFAQGYCRPLAADVAQSQAGATGSQLGVSAAAAAASAPPSLVPLPASTLQHGPPVVPVYLSGRVDDREPPELVGVQNFEDWTRHADVVFVQRQTPPDEAAAAALMLSQAPLPDARVAVAISAAPMPLKNARPLVMPPYPDSQNPAFVDLTDDEADFEEAAAAPACPSRKPAGPPQKVIELVDSDSDAEEDGGSAGGGAAGLLLVPRLAATALSPPRPHRCTSVGRGASVVQDDIKADVVPPSPEARPAPPVPCAPHAEIDRSRFPPPFTIRWKGDPLTGRPLLYPVVRFVSLQPAAAAASHSAGGGGGGAPLDPRLHEHMVEPMEFTHHLPGVGDCILGQVPLKRELRRAPRAPLIAYPTRLGPRSRLGDLDTQVARPEPRPRQDGPARVLRPRARVRGALAGPHAGGPARGRARRLGAWR